VRYVVRAVLRDGRSPVFVLRSSAGSITLADVPSYDSGRVMVAALDAYNRPGPIANVTIPALAPTCAAPRAVHGRLVCAHAKHKGSRRKR
jgi:hypothetical protein